MRLFVPKNNELMITKKKEKKKKKKRPRDRIFTQPSKYFSILKILQYDYTFHSLRFYHLPSTRPETIVIASRVDPTIVIVLLRTTIHPSYDLKK